MIDASVTSIVLETLKPLCEQLETLKSVTKYNEQTDMVCGVLMVLSGDVVLGDVQELFETCIAVATKRVAQITDVRNTNDILGADELL